MTSGREVFCLRKVRLGSKQGMGVGDWGKERGPPCELPKIFRSIS